MIHLDKIKGEKNTLDKMQKEESSRLRDSVAPSEPLSLFSWE